MIEQRLAAEQLFAGDSETARLMRSLDWSQTLLGEPSGWSQSLKTVLSILLTSQHPIFLWWGEELIQFYNDAYRPILGATKHPQAMGQRGQECWQEIWHVIEPMTQAVMYQGESIRIQDGLLALERNGYLEECYFNYAYSPVRNETGKVGGIFCACDETTRRVLGERRLSMLRELATNTVGAKSIDEVCQMTSAVLASNPYDIAFALLYLVEQDGQQACLGGTVRIDAGTLASPEQIDLTQTSNLTQTSDRWRFTQVKTTGESQVIDELIAHYGIVSGGAWEEPCRSAIVLPIAQAGQKQQLAGFLVLGISPRRAFDDEYQGFFELVASNISTAIANTNANAEDRKRAEALAELDRAKTVFFSNISHEFRTPLTLILSPIAELLNTLDQRLQENEREQLQLMQRNGFRLQKLVNTLLDFSRIEAGRMQATYQPTDLATYTAELASVFRSMVERAGLAFVIDCPALSEPIYIDRELWEKIVFNLLSNAFKFTLAGTVTIRLRQNCNTVDLTVEDTGIGIAEAEISRLFERFHQVKNSQGRSFEGSGIGLSLVQELVKLHGGNLSVTSVLGQGSQFTVSLLTGSAHLPADRLKEAQAIAPTALGAHYVEEASRWVAEANPFAAFAHLDEAASLGKAIASTLDLSADSSAPIDPTLTSRILLVDDNADMRDYVRHLLSQRYIVETATNGTAALAAIRTQRPDLVLSDVMMPGIDGFELLRQLRIDPQTSELPVILLSARAGEESRVEGLEAGADGYLIKPFSARELLALIESTLKLVELRKQTAQALQASEQQLSLALKTSKLGSWQLDLKTATLSTSDQCKTNYGLPIDADFSHAVLMQRIHPDDRTWVEAAIQDTITDQTHYDVEYRIIWDDGSTHWVLVRGNLISDETDNAEKLIGISFDITDRKQAEAAVKASNDRLRLLSEIAIDLLLSEDPKAFLASLFKKVSAHLGLEVYFNYLFEEDRQRLRLHAYGGISADIADSAKFLDLGQGVCGYAVQHRRPAVVENALSTDHPLAIPVQSIGIRAYASHPLMIGDRILGTLGLGTRQRDRFTLDELELMQVVANQVAVALERSRLVIELQTRAEALDQTNRLKDEFLVVLSHELRTPLNPILGWSKLLRQGKLDADKTTKALATIERNAQLQVQLIEDLLDISRILRGKMSLLALPIDLQIVISAALETVRLAAEAKSIQIQTISSLPEVVIGDAGRLQQVLWNLLSNAVKFTPSGGEITIALSEAGNYAQIQVTDTGKGIRADFLPYVFEHFRQQDGATTRKFGGLGLGLAIVRQIVELHGGTVVASSLGEGQGATFTVHIPLAPRLIRVPPLALPPTEESDLNGVQILVVDDETDSREFVAFVLEQHGAIVTSVDSGMEALKAIARSMPTLIISDIGMPEMDGYMLIRNIRALSPEQGGKIPAIALTAYAAEGDQRQAIAAGFQHHLAKPIDADVVVAIVSQLYLSAP